VTIYEFTKSSINEIKTTTFEAKGFMERFDLQRILQEKIEVVARDTMVLAEEYGDWEGSKRRIDLLCLDRQANLVVIELKRTEDGGHMDLQAIRYAAMVSAITLEQAATARAAFKGGDTTKADATAEILRFLEWDDPRSEGPEVQHSQKARANSR
jgi:RecB family endonuclease NucS